MKIRHTFEFTDEEREAIASHYGEKNPKRNPASRDDVLSWMRSTIDATLESITHDYLLEHDPVQLEDETSDEKE